MAAVLAAGTWISHRQADGSPSRTFHYTSNPVKVDGIYPSMFGPTDTKMNIKLGTEVPELVWITGYSARMVDPQGRQKSQEFMCHDTLSFHSRESHGKLFGRVQANQQRLFTLSQGQERVDFPEGFGIPLSSHEPLMLQSQVLNLREEGIGATISHRVETKFVTDRESKVPMKALTLVGGGIGLDVLDPQAQEPPDDPMGCAIDAGGQPTHALPGRRVTSHWVVKPGYEKRETNLGKMFPIDSKAHYISVHMHNYGKSLELFDVTAGKSVFKSNCSWSEDGKGLAEATHYSSTEGIAVFKNHQYKLISEYDNTSGKDQTAMAFIFVYIHNPDFEKPSEDELFRQSLSDELCAVPEK